jgi:hypothetical protein
MAKYADEVDCEANCETHAQRLDKAFVQKIHRPILAIAKSAGELD